MAFGTVSFAVFVLLVASALAAPLQKCTQLIAPSNIRTEHTDVWKIALEYPMNKINITYVCPEKTSGKNENETNENANRNDNDVNGIFKIIAIAKGKNNDDSDFGESIDIKTYMMTPVPGLNGTLFVTQAIPEMKSETVIKFDPEGFEISAICYSETDDKGKTEELQPWTKDTPTGTNFPFTFTDQNTLRFQMSKCDTTTNDV